jgi:streptogrisin D
LFGHLDPTYIAIRVPHNQPQWLTSDRAVLPKMRFGLPSSRIDMRRSGGSPLKLIRSTKGRLFLSASALGLAAATAAIALPQAQAQEAGDRPAPSGQQLTTFATTMNGTTAGGYEDRSTGKVVVNVTDKATADKVRRAGASPRMVTYSGERLRSTEAQLNRTASIPGTSWVIDPMTNRVVVSADESVTGAKLRRLEAAVAKLGGTVKMEKVAGTFSTRITGGDAIFSGGARCSLGFNVRRGNQAFFLTAGHCVNNPGQTWFADRNRQQPIGTVVNGSFPGNDFALVRNDSQLARPGGVNLYNGTRRDINRSANAVVGQQVQRSGSTTGLRSGQVTGLNATVNYAEGQVTGLIRTTVCAEPGDSGGALVAGSTALGLTSGGSGDCRNGGTTFFQPVTEALQVFNVQVY